MFTLPLYKNIDHNTSPKQTQSAGPSFKNRQQYEILDEPFYIDRHASQKVWGIFMKEKILFFTTLN